MTGIVIVTHGPLGEALIRTAEFVLERPIEQIAAVRIDVHPDSETTRAEIARAIIRVNRGKGVILLTDMFGGAPMDISCAFLEKRRVEVISAANLPILLKAVGMRGRLSFDDLVRCIEIHGKKSIAAAGGILAGRPRRAGASSCPFETGCRFFDKPKFENIEMEEVHTCIREDVVAAASSF